MVMGNFHTLKYENETVCVYWNCSRWKDRLFEHSCFTPSDNQKPSLWLLTKTRHKHPWNLFSFFFFRFNNSYASFCLFKLPISPLRSSQFAHTLLCQEEPLSASCSPAPLQLLYSVQLWWAEETSEKVPSEQVWHTVSSSGVPGKGSEYFNEDTWDQSCNKWNIIWDRLTTNIPFKWNKTKTFWTKWNRPQLNVFKML